MDRRDANLFLPLSNPLNKKIRNNIAANFGGNVWSALMSLAFVPLYIRLLGMEAYGLIGVYVTARSLFALLDFGLHNTLNRNLARLAVKSSNAQEMRDLLRTLELPYCLMGLVIGGGIMGLAPWIANRWITPVALSRETIESAIILMGVAACFHWPLSFYSGGLKGLQHQVLLNGINAAMATVRGCGAVIILLFVSSSIISFFAWQVAASVLHTGLVAFFAWRQMPSGTAKPRIRLSLLRQHFAFAAGLTGTAVMTTITTQTDKVVLSGMLSLESFGYYTLANVMAMNLFRLVVPIVTATFPRMSNLVATNASEELRSLYHKGAQFVSVLLIPAAVTLAFFSREILSVWTSDLVAAEQTCVIMSLLVAAAAVRALTRVPHALQLADGWTSLAFAVSVVSAVLIVPLLIALTSRYGAVGAATARLSVSVAALLMGTEIMHRRLLQNDKWKWYWQDVGRPLVACLVTATAIRALIPARDEMLPMIVLTVLAYCLIFCSALLATPLSRSWLQARLFPIQPCDGLSR